MEHTLEDIMQHNSADGQVGVAELVVVVLISAVTNYQLID